MIRLSVKMGHHYYRHFFVFLLEVTMAWKGLKCFFENTHFTHVSLSSHY
jgi:hypothetical protein